jgi:hypothetical protein
MGFEIRPIDRPIEKQPHGNEADLQNNLKASEMIHETVEASYTRSIADSVATGHAMYAHEKHARWMELSLEIMKGRK